MSEGPLATLRSQESLPFGDQSERYQAPPLPRWLIQLIDSIKLVKAFTLARQLRTDKLRPGDVHLLRDAVAHWDMPDYIFARWLQLRCRSKNHEVSHVAAKRYRGVGKWVCRIAQDAVDQLHVIPGISSLHVHFDDGTKPPSEVMLFSRIQDRDTNIFYFPKIEQEWVQALYNGVREIPGGHGDMAWVAKRSLEEFYQQIIDELWDEMISALAVLGFMEK